MIAQWVILPFIANVDKLSYLCAIFAVMVYGVHYFYQRQKVENKVSNLFAVGIAGGAIPYGLLFIISPFNLETIPIIANILENNKLYLAIFGVILIALSISTFIKEWRKNSDNSTS